MMARISKRQCEYNRSLRDDHRNGKLADARCNGCKGLGKSIVVSEEDVMSTGKLCKVEGCTRHAQSGRDGMCKSHFANKPPRVIKKHAAFHAPVVEPAVLAAVHPPVSAPIVPPALAAPSAVVDFRPDELLWCDHTSYLRQCFDEKLESWLSELRKADGPKQHAQFYLAMCNAVEGLGY